MERSLVILSLPPSDPHYPNPSGESRPTTGEEAAHAILTRYARVYDMARVEGASVSDALAFVQGELAHELEQRRW